MFDKVDIPSELGKIRQKTRQQEEVLLSEAKKILHKDLFAEKKILQNLKQYARSFEVIDEEDVDADLIYTAGEIKEVAVIYRLKFLESKYFNPEIPYEAILRIKHLDEKFSKELKIFKVLATPASFTANAKNQQCSLFVKTNYENYYLIHQWGEPLDWKRKLLYLPFRRFETLALFVMLFTLTLTLVLPTRLITLDAKATYWSGYRAAAFFHLLIFDFGVTVYFTFAFALNFSSSVWNKRKDFD